MSIQPSILSADGPQNVVPGKATVTLACIVLPDTTADELERELREALGEGAYDLEITPPRGGSISDIDTPLHAAIKDFLAEHDPDARLVPTLGYGFSDRHVFREACGSVAHGFIPFRHADPMKNLEGKHGPDEHVLVDDLAFQTQAAIAIARAIGDLD